MKLFLLTALTIMFCLLSAEPVLINKIAVMVNDDPITIYDLKKALNPANPGKVTLEVIREKKDQVLDQLISEKLMQQELKRRDIKIAEADLDRAIKNVASQNNISLEKLKIEIESQGISFDKYRNEILRKQLRMLSLKREIAVRNLDASEAELRAIYQKEFKGDKAYTAAHIVLKSESENQDAQVYNQVDSIYTAIKNKEISFAEAAKNHSQDGSAQNGGSLGTFSLRQMVPEFGDKLRKMKPGEISKPFKTRFGWHIVKLVSVEDKTPPSFEEVKTQIKNMYYQQNQEKAFKSWLKSTRKTSRIKILLK